MAFDLRDKIWHISLGDDRFHVSRYTVAARDTAAVAAHILKAAKHLRISGRSEVYSVYETGRDGWWFHEQSLKHSARRVLALPLASARITLMRLAA